MTNPAQSLTLDDAAAALAARSEVLSLDEAAAALGISSSTLRRRIRSGQLRALRTSPGPGGRLRILRSDLARLLTEMGATG
ncbi:MAG: helix-turn-helix domain-containing protein [Planctomycetes bacterium]|nr:helix-turn-helix domain-containing protein [Planctomycetota bacterium]